MNGLGFEPADAPVLQHGASDDWVAYLQQLLEQLGYSPGAADGVFGPQTEQAVRDFQSAAGLSADGIVGPATWAALGEAFGTDSNDNGTGNDNDNASGTGDTGSDRFDPNQAPQLSVGCEGDWVHYLQELLIAAGQDPGPIDGIFGPRTAQAVRDFQQAVGLDADGIVGPRTWEALDPWAEVHPTDPPYGSSVNHSGSGSGSSGSASGSGSSTSEHTENPGGEPADAGDALRVVASIETDGTSVRAIAAVTNFSDVRVTDVGLTITLESTNGANSGEITAEGLPPQETMVVTTELAHDPSREQDYSAAAVATAANAGGATDTAQMTVLATDSV